jgi:predicted RND superfamily exporter protein
LIVSSDGRLTSIVIQLDTYDDGSGTDETMMAGFDEEVSPPSLSKRRYLSDAQVTQFISDLEKILQRYQAPDFRITLAGSPVVDTAVKGLVIRDMTLFASLSIILIAVLLYLMFRRVTGVVIPIFIVVLSMISMLGAMAMFDIPITIVTQILSSFILVVGVADAVHILSIFYKELEKGTGRENAMANAMAHSGLAVAMTSLTTAGGLISFAWADIAPVAHLGVFAAFGVMLAFFYTIALLPSLMSILPVSGRSVNKSSGEQVDRGLEAIAVMATRYPKKILIVFLLLTLLAIAGLPQLRFSHNILAWLPKDLPQRQATEILDQRMRGTVSLEVIVDTGKVNGLYDHAVLSGLDAAAEQIQDLAVGKVFAGKVWSLTTVLKETHQALNENRSEFYAIPHDNELIAQEFLLFENSGAEDLEKIMDTRAQKARFTVKSPFEDAIDYVRFIAGVQRQLADRLPGASITMTGIMALFSQTVKNVMTSAIKSYVIALAVISLLMFLFLQKPSVAALSMLPNLIPIVMVLGFMGWVGIDLDSSNMLVGSIAIGLIVDDTVHFMHNFIRYYSRNGDTAAAVRNTLVTTGRALLVTSLVLCCGFLVYGFSSMGNIFNFGLLTALAIALALAADFLLAPALVILWFGGSRRT